MSKNKTEWTTTLNERTTAFRSIFENIDPGTNFIISNLKKNIIIRKQDELWSLMIGTYIIESDINLVLEERQYLEIGIPKDFLVNTIYDIKKMCDDNKLLFE